MVAIVPVMLFAPAMLVFIPPAMMFAPAAFAGFMQFVTLVISLWAVAAVMFDGFVQLMIGVRDAALTLLLGFGVRPGHGGEQKKSRKHDERHAHS